VPGLLDKKVEEDATFCLIKDTFLPLFCLTNPAQDVLAEATSLDYTRLGVSQNKYSSATTIVKEK
jgi:hypothetical protein